MKKIRDIFTKGEIFKKEPRKKKKKPEEKQEKKSERLTDTGHNSQTTERLSHQSATATATLAVSSHTFPPWPRFDGSGQVGRPPYCPFHLSTKPAASESSLLLYFLLPTGHTAGEKKVRDPNYPTPG